MKIIADLTEFHEQRSAVAIGKFDGVHLGHRKLITTMVADAKARAISSVIFTFHPSPAVFFGMAKQEMLLSDERQREIFAALGVDVLVEFPFTAETAAIPAEVFVREILSEQLHAERIVCGDDVSFGAGGCGDLALLESLSTELGYTVLVVDKLEAFGEPVSSTRIRRAIREGREEEACAMLGEPIAREKTGKEI